MDIPFLLLLLLTTTTSCTTPQHFSHHTLCTSHQHLTSTKCLHSHPYTNEFILSNPTLPPTWPQQTIHIHLPPNIPQVQLVWVDQIGEEIFYSTHTANFTFTTYTSHVWRIYIGSTLSMEISPDAILSTSIALKKHIETIVGSERVHGVLTYYKTTKFTVHQPCQHTTSLQPPFYSWSSIGKTGLFSTHSPFSSSLTSDFHSTPIKEATSRCHQHLNMWSPTATHAAAILHADHSDFSHDNWTLYDMDLLTASTIKIMSPKNRFDLYVSFALSIVYNINVFFEKLI